MTVEEHPGRKEAVDRTIYLMEKRHLSQTEAMKQAIEEHDLGIHIATLRRWSEKYYKPIPAYAVFRQMSESAINYERDTRARLGNKIMMAIELELEDHLQAKRDGEDGVLTSRDLKDLAITFGVLTDKRRLDDGEATERQEVDVAAARAAVAGRLDELAARRRQRDGDTPQSDSAS